MRRADVTRHYTIIEKNRQHVQASMAEALALTEERPEPGVVHPGNTRDGDVESAHGQFVNGLGFFVTVEPCRDEHKDRTFRNRSAPGQRGRTGQVSSRRRIPHQKRQRRIA